MRRVCQYRAAHLKVTLITLGGGVVGRAARSDRIG